jgi:hypothetical protein
MAPVSIRNVVLAFKDRIQTERDKTEFKALCDKYTVVGGAAPKRGGCGGPWPGAMGRRGATQRGATRRRGCQQACHLWPWVQVAEAGQGPLLAC